MKELAIVKTEKVYAVEVKTIYNDELEKSFVDFLGVNKYTVKSYVAGIRNFMNYLSSKGITKLTRNDVRQFVKSLQEDEKSPATIALYLSAIRRFFAWLQTENNYENITSLILGVKAPTLDKGHKREALDAGQIQSVIFGVKNDKVKRDKLEGKRDFAILSLMATCGLRTIEVVRANIEDLRTLGGSPVLYIQGKGRNDKKEFVHITAPVFEAINDYLNARGKVSKSDPLFASCSRRNFGGKLSTRSISRICKNSMVNAGFDSPYLTAHSFRHSAITIALMAGESLSEVKGLARHTSINTTMIYAHHVNRLNSLCEQKITNAIFFASSQNSVHQPLNVVPFEVVRKWQLS